MRTRCIQSDAAAWRQDAFLLFFFSNSPSLMGMAADAIPAVPWLENAPVLDDLTGDKEEILVAYGPAGSGIPRVVMAGLGKVEDFTLETFRKAVGNAVLRCAGLRVASIGVSAAHLALVAGRTSFPAPRLAEELACGVHCALYRCERFKSKPSDKPVPEDLNFLCSENPDSALEDAVRTGTSIAAGISLARDLGNGPANVVTPAYMADAARGLAKLYGFNCRVFDRAACTEMGLGAFMAVAKGAGVDPCLIVLEHMPPGTENDDPVILVGKGITFDTGGICLKPAENLSRQKTDMAGAAAVLGVFDAMGRENVRRRVVGIMPCTENMPDSHATRPGDIVTALSGSTVEIANTDAEGRLLLCDALTYAQREYRPALLVNIATLTGACLVALGWSGAGIFSNTPALAETIRDTGLTFGEHFWPMPLWDFYAEQLKSEVADLINVGPREGGAIFAGLFLKHFIQPETVWAHLDIAGTAFQTKKTHTGPIGATGFGVRTLFDLARTWKK